MQNLNDVANEIAEEMVKATYNALDVTWNNMGEEVALTVVNVFLASFIGSLVIQELTAQPPQRLPKSKQQAFTEANYEAVRDRIQSCVAAGFQSATQQFSGLDTHYYCQVKRIPSGDKTKLC